jgi:PHS family inorganic phosphate transporter-like MFS transporter
MLTAVFMCQPLGQLASTLVTLIATVRQRNGIPPNATITNCDVVCLNTMDSIWRWIIGVGIIPAVVALWFRLTIIESPRYTADVGRDTRRAAFELEQYLLLQAQTSTQSAINNNQEIRPTRRNAPSVVSGVANNDVPTQQDPSQPPHEISPAPPIERGLAEGERTSGVAEFGSVSVEEPTSRTLPPVVRESGSNHEPEDRILDIPELEAPAEVPTPPAPSWNDFKQYFWHDGNLRTLIATSFCWFFVDVPFFGLGLNSPKIITTIWYGKNKPPTQIYALVVHNVWQSLIVVSLGAIVGCAITFVAIDKLGRRNIQINGFFWLFILFVVIGGSFNHLYEIGGTSAIVVLYILCQIFFNFGMYLAHYSSIDS